MKGNDHISIPDATEHHKVNSTKSGIHASLNAQFPVLAAANYVYQQYDR
jgi:DNA replicative helicase MCM subunit Mcm2 (Cdc46/Mcm family)